MRHPRSPKAGWISRGGLAALLMLSAGCKNDEAPKSTPQEAEPAATEPGAATAAASETKGNTPGNAALLEWLDPDAVAVVYWALPADLDPDALSVVFALPPKVETMLRDIDGVDESLDAVLALDAPRPASWLAPEALASTSMVSTGTTILRTMSKPRAQVEKLLTDSGMQPSEVEGFAILVPQNAFPWKVAFLNDEVVAFIPVKEIGSGLSPLTAGRDLPPSEVETQLRTVLEQEPGVLLEVYAAGPLLHLDLGQDVLQLAVQARTWQQKGMDVQVRLLPSGDPSQVVDSLSKRETLLETDQIQALAKRVAFSLDGTAVAGRLQLTPDDVAILREGA